MATTTRVHGGKAAERQVMRLYNEGWHIPNIASIAGVKPGVVKEILESRDIDVSGIMQ